MQSKREEATLLTFTFLILLSAFDQTLSLTAWTHSSSISFTFPDVIYHVIFSLVIGADDSPAAHLPLSCLSNTSTEAVYCVTYIEQFKEINILIES